MFFSLQLHAFEDRQFSEEELSRLFAQFDSEELGKSGRNAIFNNFLPDLDFEKNSSISSKLHKKVKNSLVILAAGNPIKFSDLKKSSPERILLEFELRMKGLANFLCIKKIDGEVYMPLAAMVLVLAWNPGLHYFLQENYLAMESGKLNIRGGLDGEFSYRLTCFYGASCLILKYVRSFTETQQMEFEPESGFFKITLSKIIASLESELTPSRLDSENGHRSPLASP